MRTSILSGWNAWESCWAREAITNPWWSRITTPMLLLFSFLKTALSKFILNMLGFSAFHVILGLDNTGGFGGRATRNSSSFSLAWGQVGHNCSKGCRVEPSFFDARFPKLSSQRALSWHGFSVSKTAVLWSL